MSALQYLLPILLILWTTLSPHLVAHFSSREVSVNAPLVSQHHSAIDGDSEQSAKDLLCMEACQTVVSCYSDPSSEEQSLQVCVQNCEHESSSQHAQCILEHSCEEIPSVCFDTSDEQSPSESLCTQSCQVISRCFASHLSERAFQDQCVQNCLEASSKAQTLCVIHNTCEDILDQCFEVVDPKLSLSQL